MFRTVAVITVGFFVICATINTMAGAVLRTAIRTQGE